jgi:hypothetical protein
MRKAGLLLTGACVVSLAYGPVAWAQTPAGAAGPENTPAACSDGVDNDGNGCVDCYDPGCRPFCQAPPPQYAPPPPQYAPPPPQYGYPPPQYPPPQYPPPQYPPPNYYAPPPTYYAPPPPLYVQPPPALRPPSTGLGMLIAGIIFVPLGLGMLGGGADLLGSDTSCSNDPFGNQSGCGNLAGGAVLVTLGTVFSIMGLIFIPAGAVQLSKYSKWKREHQPMVKVDPSPNGLKLTF